MCVQLIQKLIQKEYPSFWIPSTGGENVVVKLPDHEVLSFHREKEFLD